MHHLPLSSASAAMGYRGSGSAIPAPPVLNSAPTKYFSSQSASHTLGPGRQRTNVGWYLFPWHPPVCTLLEYLVRPLPGSQWHGTAWHGDRLWQIGLDSVSVDAGSSMGCVQGRLTARTSRRTNRRTNRRLVLSTAAAAADLHHPSSTTSSSYTRYESHSPTTSLDCCLYYPSAETPHAHLSTDKLFQPSPRPQPS